MARKRKGRAIDGVVLLDKPTGHSSNDILQKVKRIYFAQKAGHTGALDPLATGMLPICLGEATKFSQYLLDSDKRYRVIAKLGERTDTSDSDGEVVQTRPIEFSEETLMAKLDSFRGKTMQVPSMFSALKHQGKPLYHYARQGIEIEREAREINVFELLFIRHEGDELELELHVSKGTYIRTIIDDLGEMLGCGAHITMLRRLEVAHYPQDKMVTLEQLQALLDQATEEEVAPSTYLDPLLLPMDTAVIDFPQAHISDELSVKALHGNAVAVDGFSEGELVRMVVGDEQRFIGVGVIDNQGRVQPKRLVVENS
ncbi:tRNA pseudouridine(55) synthase TruB [Psychrobium sp. 1_MG-2023]|uniref:tRNA pseudouridine(55) synthase TruB n=1 Tax=Psychrobium sp. 1_MG-2023 TaxID=3062624 RepID=UPI000C349558|nr:tRNA pseudouridine(55) synthase TruB [Psychrobium sp. 1_MG-2023]MDP2562853.1 tRNA pseudouridine(55) synthase TruB [Psychrobium sp. 1_MG-2023]PKF54292.1 tRNA pseudouridine(55) synthase TruB [Alteromonadales bacterium alter-6D02]